MNTEAKKKKKLLSNYLELIRTEGTATLIIRPWKPHFVLFKSFRETEALRRKFISQFQILNISINIRKS